MPSDQTNSFGNNPSVAQCLNELFDNPFSTTATAVEQGSVPLVPPINFSAAYAYSDEGALGAYHNDKLRHHRYTRDSNALVTQLEGIFGHMIGGQAVAFSSGMGAIWSVLWTTAPEVDTYWTVGSFYRKTLANIDELCALTGRKHCNFATLEDMMAESEAHKTSVPLILLESPANPFLRLVDVGAVRAAFPKAVLLYDNTMAGLLNDTDEGMGEGADYVLSSCTKYIGGHNDLLGGVVATTDSKRHSKLWDVRSAQGGILDPFAAFLIFRSLKTYDVRMERILENAPKVLEFLDAHPMVETLYYPGMYENADQSEIAERNYRHRGGVITFVVSDKVDLALTHDRLHSSKMAPSFGSTDTLIERPATMSHAGKSPEQLASLGLSMQHIRLSVGMEPTRYIIADLERLLSVQVE
jgi:cystathionine beta-lyase/cystathionine gamma-synthase